MKKIEIVAAVVVMVILGMASAQAQKFEIIRTSEGDSALADYKNQLLEDLPYLQAYQEDSGNVLKAAATCGWGVEVFAGAGYLHADPYFTPEAGLSVRYDAKKVSYRVSASALWREYNAESIEPGKKYISYAADAAFHVNLIDGKWHVNMLSLYANIGYMYGQHRYAVNEAGAEEGEGWSAVVKHNGSGVTFGGGLEYRCQFFGTGNALTIRAGYKTLPNTYVNDTRTEGMVYMSIGFNFGLKRMRHIAQ